MNKIGLMLCFILGIITMTAQADDMPKRLEPHQVNLRNYEQYVAQLKRDLPVGTSLQDVERYLIDSGISEYSYKAPWEYTHLSTEGWFQFIIRKISNPLFFIVITSLEVRIYMSEQGGRLTRIEAELSHTGM